MTFCSMTAVAVKETIARHKPATMWDIGNQRFTAVGHGDFRSTADFYRAYGVEYRALDINDKMEADIVDLNHPVDLPPRDLVVNNGTSEHLFDQAQLFETIHNISSSLMLHMLPFSPWWNHGFFNYNPILFRDLAAANGYAQEFIWIGNRSGEYVDFTGNSDIFDGKRAGAVRAALGDTPEATGYFVITLLRKTGGSPFQYPMQGRYLADIGSDGIRDAYNQR